LKIVTYRRDTEKRLGLLFGQMVYDVQACASYFKMEPMPSTIIKLLASSKADMLGRLHAEVRKIRETNAEMPLQCWATLEEVRLCAPVGKPSKIICLGRNYRDHAEEQGAKLPEAPLLFSKASSAVIDPGAPIVIPEGSTRVDYEGELAFVIGKRVRKVDEAQAADAIFGYTCLNDVSEREAQFKEKQWFRAKSMDSFAPMGPCIVTGDEIGDPLALGIETKLNSETMQSDSTRNLIFTPTFVISFITRTMTLEPGDVVSTGTPGGVGVFREPQVFLADGDMVEITIDKIGTLANPVVKQG
jgi:2-keto-4-pentenoate hydratase/2-oxohepta-3-ene-1,7-dioic acid hydratase in catechol pathway